MEKLQVKLDFNVIDKLPIEQQRELEEKCLKLLTNAIHKAERDYCKKRGTTPSKILQNYSFYKKMMNAINKRKNIVLLTETCMMFNPIVKMWTPMKFYKENLK